MNKAAVSEKGTGRGRQKEWGNGKRVNFIFHYEIRHESCLLSIKAHD